MAPVVSIPYFFSCFTGSLNLTRPRIVFSASLSLILHSLAQLLPLPTNTLLASLLNIQITRYWSSTVRKHDAWPTKGLVWCAMVFGVGNMVCTWSEYGKGLM